MLRAISAYIFAGVLLLASALGCKADDPTDTGEAPFGLTWGMTKEEIEKLGVVLLDQSSNATGAQFMATKLPKTVADIEAVVLYLGFSGKLYKITAASRVYKNDPYGHEVRARYSDVAAVLRDKYGAGKENKHVAEFYDDNRWAAGIYHNENWLFVNFETKKMLIELSCRSASLDDLFWGLIYEYKPGLDVEKKALAEHEKGAL